MSEDIYQPCPCGSGKKLKFCCFEKRRSLDQASDAELLKRATEFRVYECHVNPDWQDKGLAQVFVVRQMPSLKYLVGVYLVDVFCLGVKDTFVKTQFKYEGVRAFLSRLPHGLDEIPYEDARSIVLGAVEYARQLSFEPHEDWRTSSPVIEGARDFERKFTFGKDGKPFYIQGPYDDTMKVMLKLSPLLKEGKAHFISVADQGLLDNDFDDEEDGEDMLFEDRCGEISDYLEDELFDDARDEAEDLIEEFPGRFEPIFLMGTCLALEGNAQEAIPFLERAIALHPSPEAYYNLAGAHKSLSHIQETVTCMQKVMELDGKKGEHGKKAKAYLKELASIIQKNSGLTLDQYMENKARFDEAFKHLAEGRCQDAIRGFNQVLAVEPDHVQSFGNLGLAYAGLGDRENALRHIDKAIELDPEYQPAIDNRQIVLALAPRERLNLKAMREVEFYAEKARAESCTEAPTQDKDTAGLTRSSGVLIGRRLREIFLR